MNYFTSNLTARLAYNDPSLTEVSVRRLPLTSVSTNEIVSIVESLQENTIVKALDITIPSISHNWSDTDIADIEVNENVPPYSKYSYGYFFHMLSKNNTIERLTLRDIRSDDAWNALSNGMKFNSSIRDITLGSESNIWSTEMSMIACQSLRDLLKNSINVHSLRLKSFSLLDINGVKEVCYGLERNKTLTEIVFHSIVSDYFSLIIASIAKSMAPIQKLTFIDCDLTLDEAQHDTKSTKHPLMYLTKRSCGTLKELRLNECEIRYGDIVALCSGIQQNSTLEMLNFSDCNLFAEVCKPMVHMIRTCTTLLHLHLEENFIGDDGATLLSESLMKNKSLKTLDLRANRISDIGCKSIAKSLSSHHCHLISLTLSENSIGDSGASFLGASLMKNKSLTSLDLDACMIGDKGIELISAGLASNSKLVNINLSNNWCKNGSAISDMLSSNSALQSLDLSSCHISDVTLEQILTSLRHGSNKTLKYLYIAFNAFANQGALAIAAMLSGSNKLNYINAQYNAFDATGLWSITMALASHFHLTSFYFWNGQISLDREMTLIYELDHYINLNRAGRRAILIEDANNSIWPDVLHRANSIYGKSAMFHFLREMPAMFTNGRSCN